MSRLKVMARSRNIEQKFIKWGRTYPVVAGVYFDESVRRDGRLDLFNQEPFHCHDPRVVAGKTASDEFGRYFVLSSYVLFADMEEAILCRMAFSA
jgi:hypothetical protein